MAKKARVERPVKTTEFTIVHASRGAERGWTDLKATMRNAVAEAWDALTRNPVDTSPAMHTLRGDLQWITRDGQTYERWQLELNGGARIWYYVDGRTVYLEQVHTNHPNQTK